MEILDALSQSCYPPAMHNNFAKYLSKNFSQNSTLYLMSRNPTSPKLFVLESKIKQKYKGTVYDIKLLIYFPRNFPEVCPDIFLESGKFKVNPNCNFYINEETLQIYYNLFIEWGGKLENLTTILEELKNQFSYAFPICTLGADEQVNYGGDSVLEKDNLKEVKLIMPVESKPKSPPKTNREVNKPGNVLIDFNDTFKNEPQNKPNEVNKMQNNPQIENQMKDINVNNKPMSTQEKFRLYQEIMNQPINPQGGNRNIPNQDNYNPQNKGSSADVSGVTQMFSNLKIKEVDDREMKVKLIKNIILRVKPSIKEDISKSMLITEKAEKIKKILELSIDKYSKIDNKKDEINATVNHLKNELSNYYFPQEVFNMDMSNLDSFLEIKKKELHLLDAKKETYESTINAIKKCYEKGVFDFNTAVRNIRLTTKDAFYIRYSKKKLLKNI